jgi:hypothetical protein
MPVLNCKMCGDPVAAEPYVVSKSKMMFGDHSLTYNCPCPGKGNHLKPVVLVWQKCFGLIRCTTQFFPETNTQWTEEEYVGKASRFQLWLAIVFGKHHWLLGVLVNGKLAYWNRKSGFYGDGYYELFGLPKPKPEISGVGGKVPF